jgi:SAM-dependent methyltransferase
MQPVHRAASQGFTDNADGYARGRPDYPVALDDWLRDAVGLGPGRVAVDLGAGTGKFVPRLAATGADVVAIEPVDAMRAQLARAFPAIDARPGTADAMPLADASVDAVVCAQAFHWFATAPAVSEIARVLKPGGVLALVWNVRDESVPWVERVTGLMTPYEGDTPRYYKGDWRRVFPAPGFGPLDCARFPHVHAGAPEQVIVDRFLSVSFIAPLPADERARFEAALRALIADEPALTGREIVEMPYETVAFHARRMVS